MQKKYKAFITIFLVQLTSEQSIQNELMMA